MCIRAATSSPTGGLSPPTGVAPPTGPRRRSPRSDPPASRGRNRSSLTKTVTAPRPWAPRNAASASGPWESMITTRSPRRSPARARAPASAVARACSPRWVTISSPSSRTTSSGRCRARSSRRSTIEYIACPDTGGGGPEGGCAGKGVRRGCRRRRRRAGRRSSPATPSRPGRRPARRARPARRSGRVGCGRTPSRGSADRPSAVRAAGSGRLPGTTMFARTFQAASSAATAPTIPMTAALPAA